MKDRTTREYMLKHEELVRYYHTYMRQKEKAQHEFDLIFKGFCAYLSIMPSTMILHPDGNLDVETSELQQRAEALLAHYKEDIFSERYVLPSLNK